MAEVTRYEPCTFSWIDLGTTDLEGAKRFYEALFGWENEDMPAGDGFTYTMSRQKNQYVAGIYEMFAEQRQQGVPPAWLSYISVESADDRTKKAESLGGTVVSQPMDVLDSGRMSVVMDPTGAAFGMWEARGHIGASLVNEPGSLTWNELLTRDAEAAKSFYTEAFDWKTETTPMGPNEYTTWSNERGDVGGMMQISPDMGDMPSHWGVYFYVEDCDASAAKAKDLGGQVHVPPTDIPEVGRFAALADPQGASFSVIKSINPGANSSAG